MAVLFTNNATTTLSAGITNVATSISVAAATGALFPTLTGGDIFYATLINASNQLEIVKVTARTSDTMTVVRAQEGTTARAYSSGDKFELRPTAAGLNSKLDKEGGSITGNLDVASTITTSAIVAYGATVRGTFTEGGQLTLGYTNNTTVTAEGNSTWNIDVSSANALRVFRVGSSGTIVNALSIAETDAAFSVVGQSLYVNTDKLLVQHNGTDGTVRAQAGNLNLGAAGTNTLQLTSTQNISSVQLVDSSTIAAWGTASTRVATTAFVDRFRGLPSTSGSGKTLDTTDRGGTYKATGAVTIPASVFAADDVVVVYNDSASSIALTEGSGLTLRWQGSANTGSRTLAQRGFATIFFVSATEAVVGGDLT